jgi:hypothetical protein
VRGWLHGRDNTNDQGLVEIIASIDRGTLSSVTTVAGNCAVGTPDLDYTDGILALVVTPADALDYTWRGRLRIERT